MSAKHWMPFYVADYLADTSHLTTNQHGIYLLLMLHYWRRGPLPYDAMHLQCNNIAKAMDDQSKLDVGFVLSEFFTQENDKWRHKRIDAERQEANEKHKKRVDAARKSHESRRGNSNAGAMQEQSNCNASALQGAEQLQPQPHSHLQQHGEPQKQEQGKESCTEPDKPTSVLLSFPVTGKVKSWDLNQELFDKIAECYPGVDLMSEFRKAKAWCETNPSKRKTAKGMPRFLNGWVERSVNSGWAAKNETADDLRKRATDRLERIKNGD